METTDLLKYIGGGSFGGALLVIVWVIGNRMVAAMDRMGKKFEDHTETDLEHHGHVRADIASLRQDVAVLKENVGVAQMIERELTPRIEVERHGKQVRRTPVRGVPTEYSHRKKTEDD